jgi:hypothetical protein
MGKANTLQQLTWLALLLFALTAITRSMLRLCSAPCKALRFASTALARGLRALTVPARRPLLATA